MYTDLVLFNGNFYTLNPHQPRASALVVRDGKIVYVGDDAAARQVARPGSEAVNLDGCCAIPGLTDAHLHFQWFALGLRAVNAETETLDEALARVTVAASTKPEGAWVRGRGWNHNVWGGEFPTAAHLDRAAPNHPVALNAKSGHALWVNSRALELAGVTAQTPNPPGGQILRDEHGQPTGVLLEEAMNLVENIIPSPTLDEVVAAVQAAMPVANRAGLTGVHDFDQPIVFSAYQLLYQRGQLSLRIIKSIPYDKLNEAISVGLRSGLGNDWLRLGPVKMFADGALGPRTALMLEGYDSAPDDTGLAAMDSQEMRRAVEKAAAAGLACAIHAIGDRANREVLAVYESVMRHNVIRNTHHTPCTPLRHRIEHAQLLHPDDMERFARLGVIASMQPIHATSDMLIVDRHWGRRGAGAYAFKTLLDYGVVLAFGSDCPVETLDPLVGIHAAVTRRRADGSPGPDGWYPEQRLSVEQAVRGFTWGAAFAAGMEDRLGSLEVGKLADITLLDQDIFAIEPMDILHARVVGTIVGGRFVWCRTD